MGVLSENAIIGASAAGGYDIDYSCRFDHDTSARLTKTFGGDGDRQKNTLSVWLKPELADTRETIFGANGGVNGTGADRQQLYFYNNTLRLFGRTNNSNDLELYTNQVFRDPSAWYHIVVAMDSTQATNTNRVKVYVNGEQITSFATSTYWAQNYNGWWGTAKPHGIGVDADDYNSGTGAITWAEYFGGYLADVNFIDGQALTPSSFGQTDADTNQWKAKKYGGAYGTNGFFLEFKEGGMITYDREAEIAVTSSFTWAFTSSGNTSGEDLVNGLLTNNDAGGGWMPAGNAADRWIKFDFVTGKIYKACQWISINSTGGEGTWKWQGSNDDAAWTDIGGTFTLGGSDGGSNVIYNLGGTLNANTTSYRYYRILGISGTVNTSGRRLAMYFSESVLGLGNDNSGNGNNFTPTNLAATDQMIDTPQNSTGGNFCTLNPIMNDVPQTSLTSEGNLKYYGTQSSAVSDSVIGSTISIPNTGKWYIEVLKVGDSVNYGEFGIVDLDSITIGYATTGYGNSYIGITGIGEHTFWYMPYNDGWFNKAVWGGTSTVGSGSRTAGNITGLLLDSDNGQITIHINGSVWSSTFSYPNLTTGTCMLMCSFWNTTGYCQYNMNFGQDSSFAGEKTAQNNTDDNGCGDFYYAPPAGYLALCTNNLADPSIALPGENFNSILWTGDGTSPRSFTGVGFTPDFTWTKNRTTGVSHMLYDTVRGAGSTKSLESNATLAEGGGNQATYGYLSAFDSDGFTTTDGSGSPNYYFNENTKNFVSWNWKAGGTAVSNTEGTITSSVSANPTAGFSAGTYIGNGTAGATVGHGLSQIPDWVIVKDLDNGLTQWVHNPRGALGANYYGYFTTGTFTADTSNVFWYDPTASIVKVSAHAEVNASATNYIMYCFHSIEGYSKIGKYYSNYSTNGTFVYLGFTPAFIMLKCINATDNWNLYDIKRNGYNGTGGTYQLRADATAAGFTSAGTMIDLVSNGMKIRTNDPGTNGSSRTYIYYAIAESPFKTSNAR